MHRPAYITGWGAYLPNQPVDNSGIETVLGELPGQSAAVKRRVLINNGIGTRHYAIDRSTGVVTHSNAELTAEAIRSLCDTSGRSVSEIECLACGTSSPDLFIPSHASMVHAELECGPCETISPSGVCCAGVSALKHGFLSVSAGESQNAVVTGSELASVTLRASHLSAQLEPSGVEKVGPQLPFSNEFLRWMLSDGAGALWIDAKPNDSGPSLQIDWVDVLSYADESEVCMYAGAVKKDGKAISFRTVTDEQALFQNGYLSLGQDVRVLSERLPALMRKAFLRVHEKREISADEIDWLLPHYSSNWFRQQLYDGLRDLDFEIPDDRWFSNLTTKGNTGSAAFYIMLEELMSTKRPERGQRMLAIVPESSRMVFGFVHMSVV